MYVAKDLCLVLLGPSLVKHPLYLLEETLLESLLGPSLEALLGPSHVKHPLHLLKKKTVKYVYVCGKELLLGALQGPSLGLCC